MRRGGCGLVSCYLRSADWQIGFHLSSKTLQHKGLPHPVLSSSTPEFPQCEPSSKRVEKRDQLGSAYICTSFYSCRLRRATGLGRGLTNRAIAPFSSPVWPLSLPFAHCSSAQSITPECSRRVASL